MDKEYSRRRKRFLLEHPFCQFWMRERGIASELELAQRGVYVMAQVPAATEIHHMRKPLAAAGIFLIHPVSRQGHEWIENNKNLARQRGYLFDI